MGMKLDEKQAVVAEVAEVAKQSVSAAMAYYRGLTVSEVSELRVKARQAGVYMRVVRNTLARRAVEGTDFACLQPVLQGPSLLLFAREEPSAAARLLRDFAKDHELLEVKALVLDGRLLPASDLKRVASLPSKQEALGTLVAVLQAPITKLVRTTAETYAQLVRVMGAVRDQKEKTA